MLHALAHDARGDRPAALAALGRALVETPEPESHVRLYLDEGAPMLALLQHAARRATVSRLAAAGPSAPRTGSDARRRSPNRSSRWPTR